jgi:hypothetical protein
MRHSKAHAIDPRHQLMAQDAGASLIALAA